MKQIVLGGGAPKRGRSTPPPPRRRRRRTGRQTLNYLLLLIVAATIMCALSMTVLFHVKTIATDGLTKYAPQALIEASGIKEGDNLLRIRDKSVKKKILEKFPYIEDLHLRRVLPDKLILEVTQATLLGACESDDGYVIVAETGRILETGASSIPESVMAVYGMYMYEPQVGRILGQFTKEQQDKLVKEKKAKEEAAKKEAEKDKNSKNTSVSASSVPATLANEKSEQEREAEAFNTLTDLVKAVEETGFRDITMVDLSNTLDIVVVYDGRVLIKLGSVADLEYKLQFVDYVLKNQKPVGFQGTVDASYCTTSKSLVTSAGDITQELEVRRARVAERAEQTENPDAQDGASADQETNPYFAVKPRADADKEEEKDASSGASGETDESSSESSDEEDGKSESGIDYKAVKPRKDDAGSSGASSGTGSSSEASASGAQSEPDEEDAPSSSEEGLYSPEMLAVKPGSKKASSEPPDSPSDNASEGTSSSASE